MSKGLIGFIVAVTVDPFGIPAILLCWHHDEDRHPNLALAGFIIGWVHLIFSVVLLPILYSEALL